MTLCCLSNVSATDTGLVNSRAAAPPATRLATGSTVTGASTRASSRWRYALCAITPGFLGLGFLAMGFLAMGFLAMGILTIGTLATSTPTQAAEQATALRLQRCFDEISRANQSFADGRADIANERLLQLTHSCNTVAHLYHNLGAIAALRRDWNLAVTYLEQSLAIDRRAALTQAGLSGIYQYKAALAYRKALDLSGPLPKPPAIALQDGEIGNGPVANSGPEVHPSGNSDSVPGHNPGIIPGINPGNEPIKLVGNISTDPTAQPLESSAVLVEVASWWSSRREKAPELPPLSTTNYSIDALEENLSMVVLEFAGQKMLLIVRKTDNLWKIVREKTL